MGRNSKRRRKKITNIDKTEKDLIKNNNNQISLAVFMGKYDWEKLSYLVGIITVILSGGYVILNNIYVIIYQKDCEDFYKIPGKYFYNNIDNKAIEIIMLIICFFLFFSPSFIKRSIQKKDKYNKVIMYIYIGFLTIILGLVFGLINTLNLVTVLDKINTMIKIPNGLLQWINDNANLIILVVMIFAILAILLFCLVKEVGKIKYKKIKAVIMLIGFISYFISAVLFISAAGIKVSYSIKDKTQYEVLTIDKKNMVILSTVNDKFLITEYTLKDGTIFFMTNNYMIIDNNNIFISYLNFSSSPTIVSE